MIEVFKTDVDCPQRAGELITQLLGAFPGSIINFDLEDCDKILRVDGPENISSLVIQILNRQGHFCEVLG
jgi:hypothetical protein